MVLKVIQHEIDSDTAQAAACDQGVQPTASNSVSDGRSPRKMRGLSDQYAVATLGHHLGALSVAEPNRGNTTGAFASAASPDIEAFWLKVKRNVRQQGKRMQSAGSGRALADALPRLLLSFFMIVV